MCEIQTGETYEQKVWRLTELYGRFFSAWADDHTQMEDIGRLPFDASLPIHSIEHHKSLSVAARYELDADSYLTALKYPLSKSFATEEKFRDFLGATAQRYPFSGGNGRSYRQVLAEDYLRLGLSVAPTLGHPENRLTDSPRFKSGLACGLAEEFGLEFAKDLGLVAGAPLLFETYKGHDVDGMLTNQSDVYYTATKSDNTERYRKKAGLSEEELEEIYTFKNLGVGRAIMRDARPKKPGPDGSLEHGHIITFNPTATRANIVVDESGDLESIVLPTVQENTARLMASFQAYWPAVVLGDEINLGPIIPIAPLPKHLGRESQNLYSLQRVEDCMDLVALLINDLLGKDIARYLRSTQPGDIYFNYSPALMGAAG